MNETIFNVNFNDIQKNLENYKLKSDQALQGYAQIKATQLQNYARRNRPWTDRTARARTGLTGTYSRNDDTMTIYIAHTVTYGVYLELAMNKKYAILWPTIEENSEDIMNGLNMLLNKVW